MGMGGLYTCRLHRQEWTVEVLVDLIEELGHIRECETFEHKCLGRVDNGPAVVQLVKTSQKQTAENFDSNIFSKCDKFNDHGKVM